MKPIQIHISVKNNLIKWIIRAVPSNNVPVSQEDNFGSLHALVMYKTLELQDVKLNETFQRGFFNFNIVYIYA